MLSWPPGGSKYEGWKLQWQPAAAEGTANCVQNGWTTHRSSHNCTTTHFKAFAESTISARQLNRRGIACTVEGWDKSGTAVKSATELSRQQQASARFEQRDVFSGEIDGQWDVVFCSLFLHHLTREESVLLLQRMWRATSQWMLVDDLLRSSLGLFLAHIGCRILTRSPVVHADGPQSVRAAYTREEMRKLIAEAGLQEAEEKPHWPQRILLSWRRSR
jgi:2-polyprenyl-3-methyl-5-hydroxy-6-metoxy-1,4-benzoquinol methylase